MSALNQITSLRLFCRGTSKRGKRREPIIRLSQSGFQTARDCKRKYKHRYIDGLQRRGHGSRAQGFGKLWHAMLAAWFCGLDVDQIRMWFAQHEESDDVQRAYAMLLGYVAVWPDRGVCGLSEVEIENEIRNPATGRRSRSFSQFGLIDRYALHHDGRCMLWEHKTTSQINGNTLEKLWSDSQITGYVAALRDMGVKCDGVIYDLAQKPRLRLKKNETKDEFYLRLQDWHLSTPEAYHRETVILSDRQIQDWREDVWQVTQELLACRRSGCWPRNTGRCYDYFSQCEYATLCQNGASEALISAEYEPRESPADRPVLDNNQPAF